MTKEQKLRILEIALGSAVCVLTVGLVSAKKENIKLLAKIEELTRVNQILGKKLNESFYHIGKGIIKFRE